MKIRPKYFNYEDLPCVHCKDKLMAASGMTMEPGPKIPGFKNTIQDYYGDYGPESDLQPSRVRGPVQIGTSPDTSKIKPGNFLDPRQLEPQSSDGRFNPGNAALFAMSAFDALLPNRTSKQTVVQPQMAYNPNPYGQGSQAIMQDGGQIPIPRTKLNPQQEKDYGVWKNRLPKNLQYEGDYNLRQLWLENPGIKPSSNMHFPDKYKMPNHPTFSNESMYFTPMNQYMGGQWQETDSTFDYMPYNPQVKQRISERKGNYGYVMGEDENNSPSAKNGKTMTKAKDGNWIQKAINPAHKGYCTPMTKSTCTPRRKALAKRFKSGDLHKGEYGTAVDPMGNDPYTMITSRMDEGGFIAPGWDKYKIGGIIPDNMSNFNPHRYAHGGSVNGEAHINEVNARYPNSDLMEQWLLYQDGGELPRPKAKERKGPDYNFQYMHREPNRQDSAVYLDLYNRAQAGDPAAIDMFNEFRGEPWGTGMSPLAGSRQDPRYRKDISPMERYNQALTRENALYDAASDASIPTPFGAAKPFKGKKGKAGASVNGTGKVRDVNSVFPNTNLLEQWLLYANGGNVNGGANIREVGEKYPNSDLMEQWLLYENGGELSASKAKEMLRDGTADGKKLTAKQKKYFGMVAGGKALAGTEMPFTGDPKPKKAATPPPAPGVIPAGSEINWSSRNLKTGQIDRDALLSDRIGELLGQGYDPYTGQGRAILGGVGMKYPGMVQDLGVRLKQVQSDPAYGKMTPEQRITRFYDTGRSGTTELDQFIQRSRSLGGNQAAFYQNNPTNTNRFGMKNGGVIYEDGGEIDTMWGGTADLESYNPYDGGTVEFNGASHDNGGIGMAYNGAPIEVEGGEYAAKDGEGNLHIYGNMYMPGTRTKFKAAAGAIMNKEKRYDMLKTKGAQLVNEANPANRYDQLKFNAGQVMMNGGEMGMSDLASKKEKMAYLQKSMLDMASEHGLDPFEMSKGKMKKAKGGASIPFSANGSSTSGNPGGNDPTRADRNMNPGNIKYGKFAKKYGAKRDKDGFAIFKDRATGQKAMQELLTSPAYKNMSAKDAIRKWTGGQPYRYDLGPLTEKKVGEMDPDELSIMMGTMTKGEGTRYGVTPRPVPGRPDNTPTPRTPTPSTFTPYDLPYAPIDAPGPQIDPLDPVPPYDALTVPEGRTPPSNVEPLGINNILGEVYGLATNRVEPVPAQRYEPQMFTPYQVSFQDRLNANQSVFNAQQRAVGAGNPAALGTLGAQKYAADSAVLGDEFRTNQAIANDITNKNISLVNDANLKNLGIADTQMVRQSQARSKTREFNQMILNSISDKYAKNELENKRLAAYENLYDYRFVPTDDGGQRATYMGPNAYFNYEGRNSSGNTTENRRISRYDAQGNLKGYADYEDSDLREQQRLLDIETKRRKMPLMPVQPLK